MARHGLPVFLSPVRHGVDHGKVWLSSQLSTSSHPCDARVGTSHGPVFPGASEV